MLLLAEDGSPPELFFRRRFFLSLPMLPRPQEDTRHGCMSAGQIASAALEGRSRRQSSKRTYAAWYMLLAADV